MSAGSPAFMGVPEGSQLPQQMSSQMPMMVKQDQTYMWATDNYNIDSGIHSGVHSGAHTGAPSMISGKSSLHDEIISGFSSHDLSEPYTPYGYPMEPVDEMNEYPTQQIRAAMFPETISDGMEMGACGGAEPYEMKPQMPPRGRMAEMSKFPKDAVDQEDTELTSKAIPELIRLLNDDDQVVVSNAAVMVQKLSKDPKAEKYTLLSSPQMIHALANAISSTNDPEISKTLSGIMYNLSRFPMGLQAICQFDGVPALIKLVSSGAESVLFYAIITLHNLLLFNEKPKQEVRRHGQVVIPILLSLLQKDNPKFLAIVSDCLQILAYLHQETKQIIVDHQGPRALVHIMRTFDYDKLLWTTARAIKVLSACSRNKLAIVEAGGVHALAKHLKPKPNAPPTQQHRLTMYCLLALRNISDAATTEDNVEDLLTCIVHLLVTSNEPNIIAYCAGILSNLTCNNEKNKLTVFGCNGIEALLQVINTACTRISTNRDKEDASILDPAVCTLRHLTARYAHAEMAQMTVRINGGLRTVAHLLRPQFKWPVIKASLGLIRNLAQSKDNRAEFRTLGVINLLAQILSKSFEAVRTAQMSGAQIPCVDRVSMMEIVECSTGALLALAKDPECRAAIRLFPIIPIFGSLLYYQIESLQRVAVQVICELCEEAEVCREIYQDAMAPLTELQQSTNEAIATSAREAVRKIEYHGKQHQQAQQHQQFYPMNQMAPQNTWNNQGMMDTPSPLNVNVMEEGYHDVMFQPNNPGGNMSGGFHPQPNMAVMQQQSLMGGPPGWDGNQQAMDVGRMPQEMYMMPGSVGPYQPRPAMQPNPMQQQGYPPQMMNQPNGSQPNQRWFVPNM